MKRKNRSKKRNKKDIFILPNLFTSCSLFGGFYAIIASTQGRYDAAAIAILISSIFDALDGKIARFTNTTSQFGAEYDSLSDLVAFGVAPGLLAFEWSLKPFGRFGWLAVFLYIVCGALRLARFNIQKNNIELQHFKGLPIPGAAIFIATLVLFLHSSGGIVEDKHNVILIAIYALSFLMISTIDYFSFKKLELFKRKPFNFLIATILLFIIVAYKPALTLLIFSTIYIISGPVISLYHLIGRRLKRFEVKRTLSTGKEEESPQSFQEINKYGEDL